MTVTPVGGKIISVMEPVYIVSIVLCAIMLILLIICFYVIAKRHREEEDRQAELEAVYSDPKLAKMEYDIAFYDDDSLRPAAREDRQVTMEEVLGGEEQKSFNAGENAIFTKVDDGMEEISGHYEPEE